ncbi:unnamed protein product [Boreogadus saida]
MPSNKYATITEEGNDMAAIAAVNADTATPDILSENDCHVKLTNENSPLAAAEPPSPFSPKHNGDAASPQDNQCPGGGRKRKRKSAETENSWDSSYSQDKTPEVAAGPPSGPPLSLRQTPRPRTIFQAGLTAGTPNKTRRQHPKSHIHTPQGRGLVTVCMPIPEAPNPEVMEADSKDSAQSTTTTTTTSSSSSSQEPQAEYKDNKGFGIGELVWGKIKGFSWWPGMVVTWRATSKRQATHGMRWLQWFGDGKFSEVSADKLDSITAFPKFFNPSSYTKLASYRRAIFQALESRGVNPLSWGLKVGFWGQAFSKSPAQSDTRLLGATLPPGASPLAESKLLDHQVLDVSLPECFPSTKKPRMSLLKAKSAPEEVFSRENMVNEVLKNKQSIEEFCLSCGKTKAVTFHPLFEGGLCQACKDVYLEISYMYDDDGYQSYCTICCGGREVLLCGNANCCRCFCVDCLDILVGPGVSNSARYLDPWRCYMCQPLFSYGALKRRHDWTLKLQEFFINDNGQEFSLQNALFLVSVALMQMSCCPLTNELSD